LPELGAPVALAGEAQRLLLHRAVDATLVDAVAAGLQAVVVDDLHFADDASIEFVQALAQSDALACAALGLRAAPRRGRRAARQDARGARGAGRIETIALQPLELAQLALLIETLGLPELDVERLAPGAPEAHRRQFDVRARDPEGSRPLRPGRDARRGRAPAAAGQRRRAGRASPVSALERGAAPGARRRPRRPGLQAPSSPRRCSRRIRSTSPSRGASSRRRRCCATARSRTT
jgi:hypothetical protein